MPLGKDGRTARLLLCELFQRWEPLGIGKTALAFAVVISDVTRLGR